MYNYVIIVFAFMIIELVNKRVYLMIYFIHLNHSICLYFSQRLADNKVITYNLFITIDAGRV